MYLRENDVVPSEEFDSRKEGNRDRWVLEVLDGNLKRSLPRAIAFHDRA